MPGGYLVRDGAGATIAYVYGTDDRRTDNWQALSVDEAHRIATGIARLPDLLAQKK